MTDKERIKQSSFSDKFKLAKASYTRLSYGGSCANVRRSDARDKLLSGASVMLVLGRDRVTPPALPMRFI